VHERSMYGAGKPQALNRCSSSSGPVHALPRGLGVRHWILDSRRVCSPDVRVCAAHLGGACDRGDAHGGFAHCKHSNLAWPSRVSLLLPMLSSGVLSILGFLALSIGVGTGRVAVVMVLSSPTSAFTVVLARLFNDTRLGLHQWFATVLITAGLAP
jgi:hypothetical protein